MKVDFQCGDTITIPKGCKAIVKDGSVVFEKVQDFKDGDILVSVVNGHRYNAFIYKSTDKRSFHSYYVGLDVCNQISVSDSPSNRWSSSNLSYATEEEKQLLFNKMKEQGLQWNAEKKEVEKVRWRAKKGDRFYCFDTDFSVLDGLEEGSKLDDSSWRSYNYFRTAEQVKEAIKRMKQELRKYHDEIGE
nr:MAG TPA: hypothetical protein [Caudoviricetes sp.]